MCRDEFYRVGNQDGKSPDDMGGRHTNKQREPLGSLLVQKVGLEPTRPIRAKGF